MKTYFFNASDNKRNTNFGVIESKDGETPKDTYLRLLTRLNDSMVLENIIINQFNNLT